MPCSSAYGNFGREADARTVEPDREWIKKHSDGHSAFARSLRHRAYKTKRARVYPRRRCHLCFELLVRMCVTYAPVDEPGVLELVLGWIEAQRDALLGDALPGLDELVDGARRPHREVELIQRPRAHGPGVLERLGCLKRA